MSTNPVSAAYFSNSAPYLRGNHRIALRAEIVRELLGEPSGKRMLDLGCGNGAVSLPFAARNDLTLVDNSEAMLGAVRDCASRLGVTRYTALCADAAAVEFEPFDIVLAIGLLAHVEDPASVIATIARNLKPGGLAVIQFSDAERALNRIGNLLFKLRGRRYRPTGRTEVLRSAERSGLRLVDERSHLLILPGVPRLLGPALVPFDRFVRRHRGLAAQGVDTLALFVRDRSR